MFEDRKWLLVLIFAVVLVLLSLPVTYAWATSMASRRIVERLDSGLGMNVSVGSIDLSTRGFEVTRLEMNGRRGGILIQIEELTIKAGVFGLALRGTSAIKGIAARGVQVELELDHPGFSESLISIRDSTGRGRGAPSGSTKASKRSYSVHDLRVIARDEHNTLAQLEGVSFQKVGSRLRGTASRVALGSMGRDRLELTKLNGSMRHEDGRWKLASGSIKSGDLRWVAAAAREEGAPPVLVERLRSARSRFKVWRGGAPPEPKSEQTQSNQVPPLTSDAKLSIRQFRIESKTERDKLERMEINNIEALGEPEGWIRLRGKGEASTRGTVWWDMRVHPERLRSEGSLSFRNVALAPLAPLFPEVPWYQPERAHASGDLTLRADSQARVAIKGSVSLKNVAFSSPQLAPLPVTGVNVRVSGNGYWIPVARRLELSAANLDLDGVLAQIQGELEKTADHYRVDITGSLPATDCNRVVGAIPPEVLGPVAGFSWRGTWSGELAFAIDSRDLDATTLDLKVKNRCKFHQVPRFARMERFRVPFRHRVVESEETIFEMETGPGTPNWVPISDVSPFVIQAVVSHEDAAFFKHDGFATFAIRDALARNLKEGRYVVGASTITMQLAKNLFLHRDKTLSRKIQESILTWWLEDALSKDQILELYLNVIEYGPSLYGIGPASWRFFGRPASELSPAEGAFIASILPAPTTYYRLYQLDDLSIPMKKKMKRLLTHMGKRQRLSTSAVEYGLAELEDFDFYQAGDPAPEVRRLPPPLPRGKRKPFKGDEWEPAFDPWEE